MSPDHSGKWIYPTNKCKVSLGDGRGYLGDSMPPISIYKSYIQLFGIFEKFRLWQVSASGLVDKGRMIWKDFVGFIEGVGVRFPHATPRYSTMAPKAPSLKSRLS